jgi:hypothetical protein
VFRKAFSDDISRCRFVTDHITDDLAKTRIVPSVQNFSIFTLRTKYGLKLYDQVACGHPAIGTRR